MDLSRGVKVSNEGAAVGEPRASDQDANAIGKSDSLNSKNEAIFSAETSDVHSNNLNDLINKTFKQKYEKFCNYEKKIRASEQTMGEIMKKTSEIDSEFKKRTLLSRQTNYEEEYKRVIEKVASSIGPLRVKDPMPKLPLCSSHKGLRDKRERTTAPKEDTPQTSDEKPEAAGHMHTKHDNSRRPTKSYAIRRHLKEKMEAILSKMPLLE